MSIQNYVTREFSGWENSKHNLEFKFSIHPTYAGEVESLDVNEIMKLFAFVEKCDHVMQPFSLHLNWI